MHPGLDVHLVAFAALPVVKVVGGNGIRNDGVSKNLDIDRVLEEVGDSEPLVKPGTRL